MHALQAFAENMASLLKSGTPLHQALLLISQHHPDTNFRSTIVRVSQAVAKGMLLSDALADHEPVFDSFFIGMVKSGEASKSLPETLQRLAEQLQREENLRQKVKSALVYPVILVVGMFVSLLIIFAVVVPQFSTLFEQYGSETSALTQLLIWLGAASRTLAPWLGLLTLIALFWVFKFADKNAIKHRLVHHFQRFASVKTLLDQLDYARFCHSLSSLLQSGLPQTDAIKLAQDSLVSPSNRKQVAGLMTRLEAGETLGQCLTDLDGLNALYAHSLANAEQTSDFASSLQEYGRRLEQDFNNRCLRLAQFIEPVLIIILGTVIGLIVYALFSGLQSISGAAL